LTRITGHHEDRFESGELVAIDRFLTRHVYASGLVWVDNPGLSVFDLLPLDQNALGDYKELIEFAKQTTQPQAVQDPTVLASFFVFLKNFADDRKTEAVLVEEIDSATMEEEKKASEELTRVANAGGMVLVSEPADHSEAFANRFEEQANLIDASKFFSVLDPKYKKIDYDSHSGLLGLNPK
jgi:hypothetical protein